MNAVVREAVAVAQALCHEDAQPWQAAPKVEVAAQQVGPVAGHPAQLREVLIDIILVNALEAMSRGGTLTLRTMEVAHPDGLDGRGVEIHVGMSEAVCARLFEPLFTVTYDIVRRHRGEISLESREGQGSVWTVRLPR
ncbi:MAG: hypothetical protein ACE5JI_14925 [Acidobacteriota bacterium]